MFGWTCCFAGEVDVLAWSAKPAPTDSEKPALPISAGKASLNYYAYPKLS